MSSAPEAAIIWKLQNTSTVTALCGDRIYPREAPQSAAKPYVIVTRPPGQRQDHTNQQQINVTRTPIAIACVGETYDQSRSLSEPVINALDLVGWTGSVFWNSVEIASCFQNDDFDQSLFPQLADEIGFPIELLLFDLEHAS